MFAQQAELRDLAHRCFKVGKADQPLKVLSSAGIAGRQARLYPAQVGGRAGRSVNCRWLGVTFRHGRFSGCRKVQRPRHVELYMMRGCQLPMEPAQRMIAGR